MIVKAPSEDVKVVASIIPLLRDNTAVDGASVDTAGYDRALVIVHLGATDIACAFELEDSADDSSFADVDVISTGSTIATPTATDDNEIFLWDVDLSKIRRYLRVQAAAADGTAGITAGASILLFGAGKSPVTQQNTVNRV
jgi:hypothetical protein